MEGEWLTMSTLSTFSGAVFTVTIIYQYMKDEVHVRLKLPTRLFLLMLSWAVLIGRRYVTSKNLGSEGLYLDLINGVLVALTVLGAHSVVKDKLRWK